VLALITLVGLGTFYYLSPTMKEARIVNGLVERNIEARGGIKAWESVSALRLTGQMDIGQGMHLPYLLEQKRPGKMCLEFIFDGATTVQCADGKKGWKVVPFRGRTSPEPMTEQEFQETADSVDLYGLLYKYNDRGITIDLLGHQQVSGRDTFKLKLTLPQGAVRWLYLDTETALEVKLEAIRTIAGKRRLVETFYYEWQQNDGLLISRRQETKTEGNKDSHFLTIETVNINPSIEDGRFMMPQIVSDKGQDKS